MAPQPHLTHLTNPLATPQQLETSASQLDGIPADLESSVQYETARLVQAAGILLRLPQEIIAQAIVILTRFWTGPDGEGLWDVNAKDAAAAALYLTAKPSATPVSPKSLLSVFNNLTATRPDFTKPPDKLPPNSPPVTSQPLTLAHLFTMESFLLTCLNYQTHVSLPHPLLITYLQTLSLLPPPSPSAAKLPHRALAHIDSALFSPQKLYLTHQPNALAVAAIYLAARELGVKLPEVEWWEVFDVGREELGFVVVGMRSMEGWAEGEREVWKGRRVPLTAEEVRRQVERRWMLENGE
ncbi:hypothetical protein B0A48_04000 [Cryoendolithus antarcticus]|uniref:Cyclin N-terminal domain-containing protein n=1 Tax=Cryoendolithus antarcticus TaxID=1507870 RepID=A0A1V8TH68_9PEZI|nr:hypothetical protein B0A48_04000 [Cryoendolithus antarcticus]